jgi:predicted ATP-grasp superfamily ATP-dependent carboligase
MIAIDVPFKQHYIGGTVMIFLIDGTTIKCSDKGVRDHVDNKSIALYNFTKDEIEKLKKHRVSKIRFSIIGGMEGTETFTADNKKFALNLFGESKNKEYLRN